MHHMVPNPNLPIYVSCNINKVHKKEVILDMNFNKFYKQLREILAQQQQLYKLFADNKTLSINNNQSQVTPATHNLNTNVQSNEIINNDKPLLLNITDQPSKLWSEITTTPSLDDNQFFTTVTRRTKPNVNKKFVKELPLNKNINWMIGKNNNNNFKIKGDGTKVKRSVLHVSQLESCSQIELVEHLVKHDIRVIYCHPSFKKSDDEPIKSNDKPCTAFRVCINSRDYTKMFNPNIWPDVVEIRDCIFKEKKEISNTTTNHDG